MADEFSVDIPPEVAERLATWRTRKERRPATQASAESVPVEEVRELAKRIGNIALESIRAHDQFYRAVNAYVEGEVRDIHHRQRVEDYAAWCLSTVEKNSARILEQGIQRALDGLPKQVLQTVYAEPPVRKSWYQRLFGC